jgi:hypothetical protein
MNPYEVTVGNLSARSLAWLRGILRLYKKPLLILVAASATLAIGAGAGDAPAARPAQVASR